MSSKNDLLLRELINDPLTTKGSELDYAEFDTNIITLYNLFVELSQSSNVDAYSNAITYSKDSYVMSSNQLWKMINNTPQVDVTPGTNPVVWKKVFASDMVQAPTGLKEFEVTIPSAQLLNLFTTPQDIIPNPGADKAIELLYGSATVDFDEGSPGGTPYTDSSQFFIGPSGMDFASNNRLFQLPAMVQATFKQTVAMVAIANSIPYAADKNFIASNQSMQITMKDENPLNGDSDLIVRGVYRIIDLS